MTAEEMLPVLQRWQDHIRASDFAIRAAMAYGLRVESPMIQAMSGMQAALTDAVAARLGDRDGWLEWFWSENDCGRRALVASSSQRATPKPVRTLRHLARLIAAR